MKLFSGEEKLDHFKGTGITLTSHRVIYEAFESGENVCLTIPLEQLDHCKVANISKPQLIVGAIIALLLGILAAGATQRVELVVSGGVIMVLFLAAYYNSKISVLTVASSGGAKITATLTHKKFEVAKTMICQIEEAKSERYTARNVARVTVGQFEY